MPRRTAPVAPCIEVTEPDSPYAAAPRRATGNLLLGFGDRVIPCAVFAGTEDAGITRGEYTKVGEEYRKVGRVHAIKNDDGTISRLVTPDEVVKMVESSAGLVPLSDDEIATAIGCEGGFAEVEAFLPLSVMTMGTYVVDSLYQLRPAPPARGGGRNRRSETTEKAFGLIIKAMRLEGVFALVRVALRGKPRWAAFMPDGRLYTLRYTNEVRLDCPMPDTGSLDDGDVMLARMLVVSKTSNIAPVLTDDATALVNAYVEAKAAEQLPPPSAPREPDRSYTEMIAALRASVTGMGLTVPGESPRRVRPRIRLIDEPVPAPSMTYEYVRAAAEPLDIETVEAEVEIDAEGRRVFRPRTLTFDASFTTPINTARLDADALLAEAHRLADVVLENTERVSAADADMPF